MAATPSEDVCLVCHCADAAEGRILGVKGKATFMKASQRRGEELHLMLESCGTDKHYVHTKCYKEYTSDKKAGCSPMPNTSKSNPERHSFVPLLRSNSKPFDYPTHCLICANELDFKASLRNPQTTLEISSVEIKMKGQCSNVQESLLNKCQSRSDTLAVNIKARILFAVDICAAGAKYHRICMQAFMSNRTISQFKDCADIQTRNVRNRDDENNNAFNKLCDWLIEPEQLLCQYTLDDIRLQLATYLPKDVPCYSIKHLQRRLLEHFGSDITIAHIDGRSNIVTLTQKTQHILHQSYAESRSDKSLDDENIKLIKRVGSNIRETLRNTKYQTDVYPTPSHTDLDKLDSDITDSLKCLISSILTEPRSEMAKSKKNLIQIAICHVIMQAAGNQTFLSPLLLSIGLFIHQTTRSRVLLDVLSSLGLSVSYSQVIAFERSTAVNQTMPNSSSGIVDIDKGGGFCQWVADNFDYNEDTVSGHDTTHVMGIISCQTITTNNNTKSEVVVPRRNVSASDILEAGNFGSVIQPYKQPLYSLAGDVRIKPIIPVNVDIIKHHMLDTLWLYSSLLQTYVPNWQGFMSEIAKGMCHSTVVLYNPMIPLNPQTNEAVFSTMGFVKSQAKKAGFCCATLTFDQPLYMKGYKIKHDNAPEFENIYLRLG